MMSGGGGTGAAAATAVVVKSPGVLAPPPLPVTVTSPGKAVVPVVAKAKAPADISTKQKDDNPLLSGSPNSWLGDECIVLLLKKVVIRHCTELMEHKYPKGFPVEWKWPPGCKFHCEYPVFWQDFCRRLLTTKSIQSSCPGTVVFVPLGVRCNGDELETTGNHWSALIIDSFHDPQRLIYWDSFGTGVVHPTLRQCLIKTFPFHELMEIGERLQSDSTQCGTWMIWFFELYVLAMIMKQTHHLSVVNMAQPMGWILYDLNTPVSYGIKSTMIGHNEDMIKSRRKLYQTRALKPSAGDDYKFTL